MPSTNRTFAYYVERDAIAIVKRQVEDTANTYASPSEVKTVTIFAVKRPNLLLAQAQAYLVQLLVTAKSQISQKSSDMRLSLKRFKEGMS